jgi:hypothetical protein
MENNPKPETSATLDLAIKPAPVEPDSPKCSEEEEPTTNVVIVTAC